MGLWHMGVRELQTVRDREGDGDGRESIVNATFVEQAVEEAKSPEWLHRPAASRHGSRPKLCLQTDGLSPLFAGGWIRARYSM